MSETVLDVRNLQVEFSSEEKLNVAVDGISFQLHRGQTLGIVGESGSGKSVTSLAVIGLVPPPGKITKSVGREIWFHQDNVAPIDLLALTEEQMQQYRGGKIAMIFQEPMSSLNPVYTCGFQLTEAIRQHQNISPRQARSQAVSLLQEVKLLESDEALEQQYIDTWEQTSSSKSRLDKRKIQQMVNQQKQAMLDRYPHQLSGGQLQRVMIAIAISCNPSILIADEPTTALDVTVQATILDLLRQLRDRRQMSMMFITHDLGIIAEIADAVAVMYQGKIVEYGLVEQILKNPQHPYTKGLLACRPRLNRRPQHLLTVSDFMRVETMTTGELIIQEKKPDNPPQVSAKEVKQRLTELQKQEPLLKVHNLQVGFPVRGVLGQTKRYFMAVNGVSFEVYPGETLGLVGESGCGKTTLGRTLLQLIKPISGSVNFDRAEITTLNKRSLQQLRRDMQIIFQNPFSSLDPRIKIGDAVMEPLLIHSVGRSYKQRRETAAGLLERVGIVEENENPDLKMNRYPHEFSGGQRQRICIARALALNPRFIICDESVSSLDVSVQAQVLNLLKELQNDFKLTYIFISHDLSVVKFMSDRILVMNRGKIVEEGAAETIYREPKHEYTRQLINSIPTGYWDDESEG